MSLTIYFDKAARALDIRALLNSYSLDLLQEEPGMPSSRVKLLGGTGLYLIPTSQQFSTRPPIETDLRGLYLGKDDDPPVDPPHESGVSIDTRRKFTVQEYCRPQSADVYTYINLNHCWKRSYRSERHLLYPAADEGRDPFEVEADLKCTIAYQQTDPQGHGRIWYWSLRFEPSLEYLSISR